MEQNPGQQEESIFDEAEIIGTDYDKHVRRARNVLFILATLFVVYALIFIIRPDSMETSIFWIGLFVMAGIFVGLGIWSRKNPFYAILIGLIIYILYNAATAMISWRMLIGGIIFKVAMLLYLITGFKYAQEAKRIKDTLSNK